MFVIWFDRLLYTKKMVAKREECDANAKET